MGPTAVPEELTQHSSVIREARAGIQDYGHLTSLLKKLSLFSLTPRQVARILFPDRDGPHAFDGRNIASAEIERNPYLLCESYMPATIDETENFADLDREQRTDGPIDYFTIDIGMFPDRRFVDRNEQLQDVTVAGPERLRAFAIETLRRIETLGHSFAPLDVLVQDATAHPLFYKESMALSHNQFLSDAHLAHFRERLYINDSDSKHFLYIKETKEAEDIVQRFVFERLKLPDLKASLTWLDDYLEQQGKRNRSKNSKFRF